jgi:glucose-1-phosphate adenylyltransferase
MMMGADYYETDVEIATLLAEGKVPMGIGRNSKISNCIVDKNARVGDDVLILNVDNVQEAARPEEGFYIRTGVTVICKNSIIKSGTVI